MLYIAPWSGPIASRCRQSLRVPLHISAHLLGAVMLITCNHVPERLQCSPVWPGYIAVEADLMHLVWPACYPSLASLPLSLAVPVQLIVAAIYISQNGYYCGSVGSACENVEEQYSMLHRMLSMLGTRLPLNAPSLDPGVLNHSCWKVTTALQVSRFIFILTTLFPYPRLKINHSELCMDHLLSFFTDISSPTSLSPIYLKTMKSNELPSLFL